MVRCALITLTHSRGEAHPNLDEFSPELGNMGHPSESSGLSGLPESSAVAHICGSAE